MNTVTKEYYPYEIVSLARQGKSALQQFSQKLEEGRLPKLNKLRARFQSVNSILEKAEQAGVLDYQALVEAGLWLPKLSDKDIAKKPDNFIFAQEHPLAGEPVLEVFLRAVNVTGSAAEYYLEHDKPAHDYTQLAAEIS